MINLSDTTFDNNSFSLSHSPVPRNSGNRSRGAASPSWGKRCCISPFLCCRRAPIFRCSAAIRSSREPRQSAILCCSPGSGNPASIRASVVGSCRHRPTQAARRARVSVEFKRERQAAPQVLFDSSTRGPDEGFRLARALRHREAQHYVLRHGNGSSEDRSSMRMPTNSRHR